MQNIEYISVDRLFPHPDNPRKNLGDLTELTDAIKAKGVLQNLTVVPRIRQMTDEEYKAACEDYRADPTVEKQRTINKHTVEDGYTIIIGHRRHAAAKLAGMAEVPCVVADMTPQEQFETMMVENIQRSDLTAYEQAEGFQMMLDMGQTADQVAKKTGVSATTVRNRVKLLDLDKGRFQEAEDRGGTMRDYEQLAKIRDPEKRNKVLENIGTSNFHNALKSVLDDQKFSDELEAAKKAIREADWCKERTTETFGWNGDYKHHKSFERWQRKPLVAPKDTDVATYIYTMGDRGISIYRKGPQPKKTMSPEEEKKERYKAQAEQIKKKLNHITKMHREMREEFLMNFNAFNNDQMDIEAFAAKAMIFYSYGTGDIDLLSKITGIPMIKSVLDAELWKKMLFNHPTKALLCSTYAKMEKYGNTYHLTRYNDKIGLSVPVHTKCEQLDLLYEGLVSLGYEMSDEELQMQNGTHPLFKEAKDLVAAFKKEAKEC